jgi:hypothetical protein
MTGDLIAVCKRCEKNSDSACLSFCRTSILAPSRMCLRPRSVRQVAVLLVLSACAQFASAASVIAARIDNEAIPTATVDAMSIDEVQRIRSRLTSAAQQALEDLIDQRLGVKDVPAAALSRERARVYRAHDVKLMLPPPEALEARLPTDKVVALIGDAPIRAAALEDAAALRLYRLRGELYLQRRRNLDALIERRLLELEAQSRGVSLEQLERSLAQAEPVTDAEIQEYVSRERAAGRVVENPERVRPYLEFQKRYTSRSSVLQARRSRTEIHIDLQTPIRPRLPVETEGGIAFGPASGQVLVVYTNYYCALCRSTHLELDRLLADPRPPRIVLRDFVHEPASMEAAALVRCAARTARAGAVREVLLRNDPPPLGKSWFSADQLQAVARSAGMTPAALRACTESPEIRARIEEDTRAAHRLGFDDPPAFIAAGVPLSGMQSAGQLSDALSGRSEAELSAD